MAAVALAAAILLGRLGVLADLAGQCHLSLGRDCKGADLQSGPRPAPEDCCSWCAQTSGCRAFTHAAGVDQYMGAMCYLKTNCTAMVDNQACTSGIVGREPLTATLMNFALESSELLHSKDCLGRDIAEGGSSHQATPKDCSDKCAATPGCAAFTHKVGGDQFQGAMCYLKTDCISIKEDAHCTSGIMIGFPPGPVPAPQPDLAMPQGAATLVQTARGTGDRLAVKEDVNFESDFETSGPVVDVSSTLGTDQEILGFGGAFTEASAMVFAAMPAEHQEELLTKYFDPEAGIGYTLGRVHINSCDFSPSPGSWSEDDYEEDYNLQYFDNSVSHDAEFMIPLIKAAMARVLTSGRKLKLFASPWSPPAWMKTTEKMVGGGKLRPECAASWAMYFVKWIHAYKAHGVPIWAVTPQNEPMNPAGWEGCVYTPEEEAEWLGSHLGPALWRHHPEVLVLPYDHNKDAVYTWARTMYSHPTASSYTHGIAFHWYSGDSFENVARIHKEYPQALLLPTEATWEKKRWGAGTTAASGDWSFGEGYAHDIIGDLNAGAAGWTDWNLLLDKRGGPNHSGNYCDAPMMADDAEGALYLHPQYYYIGHFSKYLPPGSRRILAQVAGTPSYRGPLRSYGTCTGEDGLEAVAFLRPDNRVAAVVLNCGDEAVEFKLKDGPRAIRASVPAHGIQTYVFEPSTPAGWYV